MSSIRRRSTVHDFASLRLHPDGSRVQNIASSSVNAGVAIESDVARASANTRSRLVKTTVRDAQGNWIARDAGGRAAVKYKRVRRVNGKVTEGSGRAEELDPEHESRGQSLDLDVETEGEEGSRSVKDPRAKKRMKFLHDYSFLETNSPPQLGIPGPSNPSQSAPNTYNLPLPSSDLLKFIHYFASEHYAANGLLFDASSEFRKERKARKMQKLRKLTLKKMRRRDVESENDKNSGESEENSDLEETDSSGEEEEPKDERKPQRGAPRKSKASSRDMYRAFDGSALMAIGMLLQEHILQTMSSVPPEGWEEEMLAHEANANILGKGGRRKHRGRQKERNDSIGVSELRDSVDDASLPSQETSKRESDDSEESKEDSSSESSESSSE